MRTFLTASVLALLAVLPACSVVCDMTPAKYVGLVVAHAARLKIEIARSLESQPAMPIPQAGPLQLIPPSGLAPMPVDFGWVTNHGAIVIQSKQYNVVLVQEPVVTKDGVIWTCVVHPAEAKPALCGSDDQNAELQRLARQQDQRPARP